MSRIFVTLLVFFTLATSAKAADGFEPVYHLRSISLEGDILKFSYVVGQDPNKYSTLIAVDLVELEEKLYGSGAYSAQVKISSKGPSTYAFIIKNDGTESLGRLIEIAKQAKEKEGYSVNRIVNVVLPPLVPAIQGVGH